MKLVIEIDKSIYDCVIGKTVLISHVDTICKAIADGTLLPKGHGDLVDFDRLCREYWDGDYMEIYKDDLSNIKPIIEADREVQDADSD